MNIKIDPNASVMIEQFEEQEQLQEDGLKVKYEVRKKESGELVDNCFVLRPGKDPAAIKALLKYADSTENKELSNDIIKWVEQYSFFTVDNKSCSNCKELNECHIINFVTPTLKKTPESFSCSLHERQ